MVLSLLSSKLSSLLFKIFMQIVYKGLPEALETPWVGAV